MDYGIEPTVLMVVNYRNKDIYRKYYLVYEDTTDDEMSSHDQEINGECSRSIDSEESESFSEDQETHHQNGKKLLTFL